MVYFNPAIYWTSYFLNEDKIHFSLNILPLLRYFNIILLSVLKNFQACQAEGKLLISKSSSEYTKIAVPRVALIFALVSAERDLPKFGLFSPIFATLILALVSVEWVFPLRASLIFNLVSAE